MRKLATILTIAATACAFSADVTDVKVRVLDGFGGDTSSVASRCQTKAGQQYDPVIVTRDVNALKRCRTFLPRRCANAVDVAPDQLAY